MAYLIAAVMTALLVALDQISKYLAVRYLFPIGTHNLIPGIFSLTYTENQGAAFGMMQGGRWFFIILTSVILAGVCVYYVTLPKGRVYNFVRAALVLVLAGAAGNLIDRVRQGYVVDFLHMIFIDFPVFNAADICIVTGTVFLAVMMIFVVKDEGLKGE